MEIASEEEAEARAYFTDNCTNNGEFWKADSLNDLWEIYTRLRTAGCDQYVARLAILASFNVAVGEYGG